MIMTKEVYQSKFGFHPVSLETSKKLRFINGVYAKAQHVAGAWERWDRKDPQNRVIKIRIKGSPGIRFAREIQKDAAGEPVRWLEPRVCHLFHKINPSYSNNWGKVLGFSSDNGLGQRIIDASRSARMPVATPELVESCPFTEEEIDNLYNSAKSWLENEVK